MDFLNKHPDIISRYDLPSSTGINLQREIRQECRKPGVGVALTRCRASVLLTTSESGDGVHEGKRTHPKMPLEAGGFPCSYAHSSTIWSGAQAIGLDCALPLLNY